MSMGALTASLGRVAARLRTALERHGSPQLLLEHSSPRGLRATMQMNTTICQDCVEMKLMMVSQAALLHTLRVALVEAVHHR